MLTCRWQKRLITVVFVDVGSLLKYLIYYYYNNKGRSQPYTYGQREKRKRLLVEEIVGFSNTLENFHVWLRPRFHFPFCFVGNYGNQLDVSVPPSASSTSPTNAIFDGCYYYFLPWNDIKPCCNVDSHWEDIAFRLEPLNILSRMCEQLVSIG